MIKDIVRLSDRGNRVADIAAETGVPIGAVYTVLRKHRPNRRRARRPSTSWRPTAIRQLAAKGIHQSEIARLLDVSRQRVSAVLRH